MSDREIIENTEGPETASSGALLASRLELFRAFNESVELTYRLHPLPFEGPMGGLHTAADVVDFTADASRFKLLRTFAEDVKAALVKDSNRQLPSSSLVFCPQSRCWRGVSQQVRHVLDTWTTGTLEEQGGAAGPSPGAPTSSV